MVTGSQTVKLSLFNSSGQLVWETRPALADGATDIQFSSNPFYSNGTNSVETITVGSATFTWNGLTLNGGLAGTGDYRVKAEVVDLNGTHTTSKVLTLIIQKQDVLGGVALGPNPAKRFLAMDLSLVPGGIELEIVIWNLSGEVVRKFNVVTGSQPKLIWDLSSAGGHEISNGVYGVMIRSTQSDARLQDKRYFKVAVIRN